MGIVLVRWIGPSSSTGSPMTFMTRPSVPWPTGTVMGPPMIDGLHAAHHALGGFHGDAAHAAFAQVLLHFEDDVDGRGNVEALADDAQRLVDRRHRGFGKLHVHGRTGRSE